MKFPAELIVRRIDSISCHGFYPWLDAVLARGHATGKWRPGGSSLDSAIRFFIYLLLFWAPYSSAVVESSVVTATLLWLLKRGLLYWQERPVKMYWNKEPLRFLKVFQPKAGILNRPIGLFLFFCLLTTVGSAFWEISWHGFFTKTLEWFVIYCLILEVFTEKKYILRALGVFIFSSLSMALYSLGQFYFLQKDIWVYGNLASDGRATAAFHTGNELGGYLTLLVPLALSLLFLRNLKNEWYALFMFIFFVFGFSLAATFSRAAWGAVFVGILFCLYFLNRKALIVSLALAILLGGIYFMTPADIKKNLRVDSPSITKTASGRLEIWKESLPMIADRPLFGHGLNTYMRLFQAYRPGPQEQNPTYAHNCYIQMAAEVGILGLGAFLWILACLFSKSLTKFMSFSESKQNVKIVGLGLLSGILAFLLQASVETHFYSLRLAAAFWAVAGLLVSFLEVVERVRDS